MEGMSEEDFAVALANLSGEKKALILEMLGVTTEVRGPKKKVWLSPYNLACEVTCRTCGTTTTQYFAMLADEKQGGLVSVVLMDRPEKCVTQKRMTRICGSCEGVLMTLPKEEVVARLLRAIREAL